MSMNVVTLMYLSASVCFIQSLKGLSHPTTSIRGNAFGMLGMAIAIATTGALTVSASGSFNSLGYAGTALLVGAAAGTLLANRVEMTKMPQLVAFMHSMIGLAAVFIALVATLEPQALGIVQMLGDAIPIGNRLELFLGAAIGAITFTGSVVAFGKLNGRSRLRIFQGAPIRFKGQHQVNLALGVATVGLGVAFMISENWPAFLAMLAGAFVLGILLIIPIGGADMPVVVSMLNSYSGWAAAGIGFSLNNSMLIVAGSLVGASGAILSYIMCKAMNRPFWSVIMGGVGAGEGSVVSVAEQRPVKTGSAEDAAFVLSNAESVVIIPGYGLAVARAQHALKELTEKLVEKGISARHAIHPVAGRMPGHMNVLLAEAEVPYEHVYEMEDINGDFGQVDVAIVLGANDVVNPAAQVPGSPIFGMPILEAYKAKTIIVNKRSMATGYAGLDNDLFYLDKTMMVFGDAKKIVEDIAKAIE